MTSIKVKQFNSQQITQLLKQISVVGSASLLLYALVHLAVRSIACIPRFRVLNSHSVVYRCRKFVNFGV